MNTEITDNNASTPAGWVFFDAECRFCVRGVKRWSPLFSRRGYIWQPLQTPGAAQRLGVGETELRAEMKLLTADAKTLGGVDAWACLFRSVWWLWPVGALLALPGMREAGALVYRWIARHRHCLGGSCSWHGPRTHAHRHTTFFEMP